MRVKWLVKYGKRENGGVIVCYGLEKINYRHHLCDQKIAGPWETRGEKKDAGSHCAQKNNISVAKSLQKRPRFAGKKQKKGGQILYGGTGKEVGPASTFSEKKQFRDARKGNHQARGAIERDLQKVCAGGGAAKIQLRISEIEGGRGRRVCIMSGGKEGQKKRGRCCPRGKKPVYDGGRSGNLERMTGGRGE